LALASELPLVLQQILKGYQRGAMGSSSRKAVRESLALSLGEFLSHEAEFKTKEQLALAEELALVKEQLAQQAQVFSNNETALHQEVNALRQVELEANKKLFHKGQECTTLVAKVVQLCTQVVELEEEAGANKARMVKLEERATDREVQLGKVEAELTAQTEAIERAKADLIAQVEAFERAKVELIDDAVDAYAPGFEDALAQVACKHPQMDASPFATSNHVVDGQIMPRRPQ